jgi:hypothetical protein
MANNKNSEQKITSADQQVARDSIDLTVTSAQTGEVHQNTSLKLSSLLFVIKDDCYAVDDC